MGTIHCAHILYLLIFIAALQMSGYFYNKNKIIDFVPNLEVTFVRAGLLTAREGLTDRSHLLMIV
jgi:hypothetical protein